MLADATPIGTLPAADFGRARKFYENTLGFSPAMEMPGGVLYRAGDGVFLVYESAYAGTSQATALSWNVEDLDAEIAALREEGIRFETYDLPDTRWEDGVAIFGEGDQTMRSIWFKDSEGNILAVGKYPM